MSDLIPPEVMAISDLHPHLLVAAHRALAQSSESIRPPGDPLLDARYHATLGHLMNYNMHEELLGILSRQKAKVSVYEKRNFVALSPKGTNVALRLGACDGNGCPRDTGDREDDAPFAKFKQGTPLLFEEAALIPVFAGYSVVWKQGDPQIDRFILAKYEHGEHMWSFALDPIESRKLPSVLDGRADSIDVVPVQIPIGRLFGT